MDSHFCHVQGLLMANGTSGWHGHTLTSCNTVRRNDAQHSITQIITTVCIKAAITSLEPSLCIRKQNVLLRASFG